MNIIDYEEEITLDLNEPIEENEATKLLKDLGYVPTDKDDIDEAEALLRDLGFVEVEILC